MPDIYRDARELEHTSKVDGGQCDRLVQHFTNVGSTSTWYQGSRVLDHTFIEKGAVIATSLVKVAGRARTKATMPLSSLSSDLVARTASRCGSSCRTSARIRLTSTCDESNGEG